MLSGASEPEAEPLRRDAPSKVAISTLPSLSTMEDERLRDEAAFESFLLSTGGEMRLADDVFLLCAAADEVPDRALMVGLVPCSG